MLVDIVSKNGSLLIDVVQRPDGSLDAEAEQILAELADWIAINGGGIYETRPWLIHGEGLVRAKGGHFKEDFAYTAKDLRFTSKGENTLYAFAMGWPAETKLVIRSLGKFPGVDRQDQCRRAAWPCGPAHMDARRRWPGGQPSRAETLQLRRRTQDLR